MSCQISIDKKGDFTKILYCTFCLFFFFSCCLEPDSSSIMTALPVVLTLLPLTGTENFATAKKRETCIFSMLADRLDKTRTSSLQYKHFKRINYYYNSVNTLWQYFWTYSLRSQVERFAPRGSLSLPQGSIQSDRWAWQWCLFGQAKKGFLGSKKRSKIWTTIQRASNARDKIHKCLSQYLKIEFPHLDESVVWSRNDDTETVFHEAFDGFYSGVKHTHELNGNNKKSSQLYCWYVFVE